MYAHKIASKLAYQYYAYPGYPGTDTNCTGACKELVRIQFVLNYNKGFPYLFGQVFSTLLSQALGPNAQHLPHCPRRHLCVQSPGHTPVYQFPAGFLCSFRASFPSLFSHRSMSTGTGSRPCPSMPPPFSRFTFPPAPNSPLIASHPDPPD